MLCLFNFLNEHKQEAYQQQDTGCPDSSRSICNRKSAANTCTNGKQKYNGKITQCLMKQSWLSFTHIRGKSCGAASQISNAHGAGIGIAFHLSESLYLQCTGEGYHSGSQYVHIPRYEAYQEKQDNFYQKDSLAPMKAFGITEFVLNSFC